MLFQFKKNLVGLGIFVLTSVLALAGAEAVVRLKNSTQQNYTIEMWKYANELKEVTDNPLLGHSHIPNASAVLQNIPISINSLGLRGPEVDVDDTSKHKVLLLGSSITLGWGVKEEETLRAKLEEKLGSDYLVLNGGVGNYNTLRAVSLFEEKMRERIKPQTVVLHYFVNDAEYLPPSSENILFANSQLAVLLYYQFETLMRNPSDISSLEDHYKSVYDENARGYKDMVASLDKLNAMAKEDGFRVVVAMMPDVHQLEGYPFGFIHERIRALSLERGWEYVDLLPGFNGFKGPELWTIPGDPHPNGQAHDIMADMIYPVIAK